MATLTNVTVNPKLMCLDENCLTRFGIDKKMEIHYDIDRFIRKDGSNE